MLRLCNSLGDDGNLDMDGYSGEVEIWVIWDSFLFFYVMVYINVF